MATKKTVLAVIAVLFTHFALGNAWAKQAVTVVGDASYPPYSYVEDGQPKGIYVDILKKAFSKMTGYDVAIKMLPWKSGINKIKTGTQAAIFPPYYSEKRVPWMSLSEPILKEEIVVFGTAEKLKGKTVWPDDFYGSKIGLNFGYSPEANGGKKFVEAVEGGKIKLDMVGNTEQNLKKLASGRLDYYLCDKMIDSSAFPSIKRGVAANTNDGYLGFTKKMENFGFIPEFKKEFDAIIKEMKASGEIDNVIQSYLK